MVILASFWKTEACGQTVLPDRSLLIGQKLVEKAKIEKSKCDILGDFQTLCKSYLEIIISISKGETIQLLFYCCHLRPTSSTCILPLSVWSRIYRFIKNANQFGSMIYILLYFVAAGHVSSFQLLKHEIMKNKIP